MEYIALQTMVLKDFLQSFATVTRFTAVIDDRSLRIAVSHIVANAPHNGTHGFLAASEEVQKLSERKEVSAAEAMNLYTVRDALKRIHEQIN